MATQLTFDRTFIQLNKQLNKGKKRDKKEERVQMQVCKYIRTQYPGVIFNCDLASGMKLTMGQAVKAKMMRSERGYPDLTILAPSKDGLYSAMCLELKNKYDDVYLKGGMISDSKSAKHIREQSEVLKKLRDKKFFADFGLGFDDSQKKIDAYFSL